jgi:type II secretory pathway component PulK
MRFSRATHGLARRLSERGSVLVIVLWIAFGLVSIALYFGQTMSFELKAADNSAAAIEAEQAIAGAQRYVTYLLSNSETPGFMPDVSLYESEEVPVGEAAFWFIGRADKESTQEIPTFGLVDEASKLNLNSTNLTVEMLQFLPRMTPELAGAIIDWRDTDEEISAGGGAEMETYSRRNPPYRCKNKNFESVEELRLVMGAEPEILFGEDLNRNGVLDPNENDGDASLPYDNRDGRLDPGILEYFTVFSRQSNKRGDGSARINVNTGANELGTLLEERGFNAQRVTEIQARLGTAGTYRSLLEFYIRSGMTVQEFDSIAGDVTVADGDYVEGLVNVNTASAAVLGCIPGIGIEKAPSLVAYRQSITSTTNSVAWVKEALNDDESAIQAGPYLTSQSYQLTADVAAVGHYGRGYRRVQLTFDTTEETPKIIYRRDLSGVGWALGRAARERMALQANTLR